MNSSTSSFRNELKVFLVVFVIIGALEVYQRIYYAQRQRDLSHPANIARPNDVALLHQFPEMADALVSQPGISIVLLGNSLTQNGYDLPQLNADLATEGHGEMHVGSIALAGSNPIEWYHNLADNFIFRGKIPRVIVINMSPSGIYDDPPAGYRIGWLANETRWSDVPEVLLKDLQDTEVGGQYLQARLSMLYANRWDIRVGLLYNLFPNVQESMEWVNTGQSAPKPLAGKVPPKTYSLLTRLLELAKANHIDVILVAMPARERYEIEPGMPPILKAYNVAFLDARMGTGPDGTGLKFEDFEDGWHLNPEGQKIFTPYMARQLPPMVRAFGTPQNPPS